MRRLGLNLSAIWAIVIKKLESILASSLTILKKLGSKIATIWDTFPRKLGSNLPAIWATVKRGLESILEFSLAIFKKLGSNIATVWDTFLRKLWSNLPVVWAIVKRRLESILALGLAILKKAWLNITTFWDTLPRKLGLIWAVVVIFLMRKLELFIAIIFAMLIGGGILLASIGLTRFDESGDQQSNGLIITALDKGIEATPVSSASSGLVVGSNKTSDSESATLPPANKGNEESVDLEDLLLLYSSEYPSSFDINYCMVAEFYGLLCKKIDLAKTDITAPLLRDGSRNYFKLIGVDADVLHQRPELLSDEEISVLKTAVISGGVNLLISNLNKQSGSSSLTELTDGAILSVTVPLDRHRDWIISSMAPEITHEFTGQVITSTTNASQIDFGLTLNPITKVTPLISSKDDAGTEYLIFAKLPNGAGSIFLNAGAQGWSLDTLSMKDVYYSASHFSEIIPLMFTIRNALGEEAWHNDYNYANLTIDHAALTEPFENINYTELLDEMKTHNFHTTIAFSPVDWERSEVEVTSLFAKNLDRYSLVQYGNNADGYEFYKYSVTVEDQFPAKPLADQEWNILEGLSRMETHKKYTGIPYDRVMVFPVGISPEATLVFLKKNNYLASVNVQDIPLGVTPPSPWESKMAPANLSYGNFPLLTRRPLGADQPFQSTLQPVLFDLFVEKPALMFFNANESGIFTSGIGSFNQFADQVNRIQGGVKWLSLGDVIKNVYLEKVNDDGSIAVQMYTNDLILTNRNNGEKTYHVKKEEALNVTIASLSVNNQEYPYTFEDGFLSINIKLPARTSVELVIKYR